MREIKFRGKRVDNDGWADGYFHRGMMSGDIYVDGDIIIPETVGQYTGRKDKNDVEIYEGDILEGLGYVVWDDIECRYLIDIIGERHEVFFDELPQNELEVIGNIHDDHVLIEEMNGCQLKECLTRDPTDDMIQQLIEDIELNEWYCDVGVGESSLLDWEKSLIIEGLRSLSTKEINQ